MLGFIKRALVRGVVVSGLVMSLLLTVASIASADVDTEPHSATPGSVVTVSGSVDVADLPVGGMQEVDICWDTHNCEDPMATTTVGLLDPTYSVDVTIPAVEPGEYEIYACTSLDGCDSADIEVVAEVSPTTTTTTLPPTTTTTQANTTTTTTTTTGPTTGPTTTTTTAPASATTSPEDTTTTDTASTTPGVSEDAEVETVSLEADDLGPPSPESEDITSTTTPSRTYTPPTTAYTPPTSNTETTISEDEPLVVNAADPVDDEGWSFDSPVVFWTAWLLVVIVASALASTFWWLADRRRKAQ